MLRATSNVVTLGRERLRRQLSASLLATERAPGRKLTTDELDRLRACAILLAANGVRPTVRTASHLGVALGTCQNLVAWARRFLECGA